MTTKHTLGPWELMLGNYGRNKVCASYGCINGLSALFTIADVRVPGDSERGYTDDAFNPEVAAANARLIVEAPTLYEALTGLIYGADETTKERARARAISAIARVEGQQ